MIDGRTMTIVTMFAIAMAQLEAAVVVYLRRLHYAENPLDIFPLKFLGSYDVVVELSREFATVIMILAVALLLERSSRIRSFAAFVFVFGVWDIFYYVWLKILIGWPRSWLEWDVLFLIPIVWLGPWMCPVLISLLFVTWGFRTLYLPDDVSFTRNSLTIFSLGVALGLFTFFQPAAEVLMDSGTAGLREYTPGDFWWWLFIPSVMLMACGLGMTLRTANGIAASKS
jgi:hypothetical protein